MTTYPSQKDTTTTFYVIDGVTPIDAALFRRFSSAILAIENTLGLNPAGIYSDIRQRLDAIDGYTSEGGNLPLGTLYQHLENNGITWAAVDDLTLPEADSVSEFRTLSTYKGNIQIYAGVPLNPLTSLSSPSTISIFAGGDDNYKHGIQILGGDGLAGETTNTLDGGDIKIIAGSAGTGGFGGNIELTPGNSSLDKIGKIFINTTAENDKYSIYANTGNLDGYYPGIRYNGDLDRWEYKNDGIDENNWAEFTATSSESSIVDILWGTNVIDGYLVYTDNYSSSPKLKIANLAIANDYSYSKAIGAAYSTTDKVLISGVHSIYCESAASPHDQLYLSQTNYGMATNVVPSNNCFVKIGICFEEKSSGIGKCNVLLKIEEPILLEEALI